VKTVQIGRFENRAISGVNPAMGCSGKEAIQKKIHGKKSWSWKHLDRPHGRERI
jgi:hypothetical protein